MKSAWPASVGALFLITVTVSLFVRQDPLEFSPTSYGTLPGAYGALHDLFAHLDVPIARSFAPPERLPPDATVWWIEPDGICAKLAAPNGDEPDAPDAFAEIAAAWDPAPWIRAGGTAVIFASGLSECSRATQIGGLALPVANQAPLRDEPDSFRTRVEWPEQEVTGHFLPATRRLPVPTLATFASVPDGFAVIAQSDGVPFAIEAALGDGRLVLIADSVFLRNHWLDAGDAAPLAFDCVRAYGVPRLDEREHGLSDTPSTAAYLVRSPALPVFAGLAATGVLFGWAGASLPRRRVGEVIPTPPTLRTYVDSLARLYSRAGDHREAFLRYREHALARLRDALHLAHDAPVARVQEMLRERGQDASDVAMLGDGFDADEKSMGRACDALDRLLEATR